MFNISRRVLHKSHSKEIELNCYIPGYNNKLFTSVLYNNSVQILKLLQDILKFRVNYIIIDENDRKKPLQYLTGSNDLVVDNFVLQHLPEDINQLLPITSDRLALLYKTSSLPVDKDIFVRNVTGNVWFYLGAVLILLALCFRLSTHTHNYLKPKHSDWSWLEVVQWTFGAICQQGSAKHPQGCSCRTMFVIGYLITYMIYTGYAAGITSLLAVKSDTQNLEWDKAMGLHLPFIALCDSEGDNYLKVNISNESLSRNIYQCVETIEDLLRKVENLNFAGVISEKLLSHYLIHNVEEEMRCKLSVAKQNHYTYFNGFLVKHNFVLKQKFNYWLLRFKEHGLLARIIDQSVGTVPVCQMPPGYTEVGLEHVKSAFYIMELTMLSAIVIFLAEKLSHRNKCLLQNKKI